MPNRQRRSRQTAEGLDRTPDWPVRGRHGATGTDGTECEPISKAANRPREWLDAKSQGSASIEDISQTPGNVSSDQVLQSQPQRGPHYSTVSGARLAKGSRHHDAMDLLPEAGIDGEDPAADMPSTDIAPSSLYGTPPYTPLHLLGLPAEISTCLMEHDIWSAQELCALSAHEVVDVSGIDRASLTALLSCLWSKGLSLRTDAVEDSMDATMRRPMAEANPSASGSSRANPSAVGQSGLADCLPQSTDSLETIGLSRRTRFALEGAGVRTIEQLVSVSSDQLLASPGFEPAMVNDIAKRLGSVGLSLTSSREGLATGPLAEQPAPPLLDDAIPSEANTQARAYSPSGTMSSTDAQETPLARLALPLRAYNALMKSGICTIEALCSCSAQDVRSVRNIGVRSLLDIVNSLQALGLKLAESTRSDPVMGLAQGLSDTYNRQNEDSGFETGSEQLLALRLSDRVLTPLQWLNLSPRPHNALIKGGIDTVEALCQHTVDEVLTVRSIGKGSLREIESCLHRLGLALAEQRTSDASPCQERDLESAHLPSDEIPQREQYREGAIDRNPDLDGSTPLDTLGLPLRVTGCLQRHGVSSVEDLCQLTPGDLYRARNIGVRAVSQIEDSLWRRGRWLRYGRQDPLRSGRSVSMDEPITSRHVASLSLTDVQLWHLQRANINTIGALIDLTPRALRRLVPASQAHAIEKALAACGLRLSVEPPPLVQPMHLRSLQLASLAATLVGNEASIRHLYLNDVTARCLLDAGIRTVGELASLSEITLKRLDGIVASNLDDIRTSLHRFALLRDRRVPTAERPLAAEYAADGRSLSALDLCPSVLSSLSLAGFATIGDVASSQPSLIYELTRGNREALEECRKALGVDYDQPTVSHNGSSLVVAPSSTVKTIAEVCQDWLSGMSERDQQIARCYVGLGGEYCTLQQIGDAVNLTRERVRQIGAKQVKRLQQKQIGLVLHAHTVTLHALATSLGGVMTKDDIEYTVADSVPIGDMAPTDAVILIAAASRAVEWLPRQQLLITSELGLERLTALWDDLDSVAADLSAGPSADDLVYRVSASWSLRDEGVDECTVRAALRSHRELSIENDRAVRASGRPRLDSIEETRQALEGIGQPAHYAAIAVVINDMRGEAGALSDRTVHQRLLRRTDRFVRTGPGTFALAEWAIPQLVPSLGQTSQSGEPRRLHELKEALRAIGHPAHYRDISREVARLRAGSPAPTERTIYQYLVSSADVFVRHGRGIYGLPEWERPGEEDVL